MHEHFWVGLAVGPAILVVYIALIAAAIAVRRAWKRLHWRAVERLDLAKNRKRVFLRGQPDPDADKPEYLDAAKNRVPAGPGARRGRCSRRGGLPVPECFDFWLLRLGAAAAVGASGG